MKSMKLFVERLVVTGCGLMEPLWNVMEPRYNSFGTVDFRPRDGLGAAALRLDSFNHSHSSLSPLLAFPPQAPFRHTSPTADATRIAHPHCLELSRRVYATPHQSGPHSGRHMVRHVVSYHTLVRLKVTFSTAPSSQNYCSPSFHLPFPT